MKLLAILKKEFLEVLPPTIFFFVAFCVLNLTRNLLAEQFGMPVASVAGAALGALVVGKAILISDKLPGLKFLARKPLVYTILAKTGIYFLVASLLYFLEEFLPFLRKFEDFGAARVHFLAEAVWPHIWLIHIWLVLLLLIFCTVRALASVLGRDRIMALLFGPPESASVASAAPTDRRPKPRRRHQR